MILFLLLFLFFYIIGVIVSYITIRTFLFFEGTSKKEAFIASLGSWITYINLMS
jgi:hypothetical protein